MTCKLADPFSHVHPLFWPVLWLSLRAFVAWSGKMIEEGHGFAGLRVEISWYGWIHVARLDLSPQRAAFHRHMAGEADESWQGQLAACSAHVEHLLAPGEAAASAFTSFTATEPLAPPSPLRVKRGADHARATSLMTRLRAARPPPSPASGRGRAPQAPRSGLVQLVFLPTARQAPLLPQVLAETHPTLHSARPNGQRPGSELEASSP